MTSNDVCEAVRAANTTGSSLRIAGNGTWLDAGRPVSGARPLSLAGLTGIVNYEPGDFTLTARAGTTLGELAAATLPHRQFLALDPFGDASGTLGATVATAASGPLAHAFGSPRDNVLGLEVITGDGSVVRCGGRVVKNVAGFDLTRVFTGSWGTLGVITEVSVRLRALPSEDETYFITVDDRYERLLALLSVIREASIAPFSIELISPALARQLALPEAATLLVRLGGNATSVGAQRTVLSRLGDVREAPPTVWSALRAAEPGEAIVVRLSSLPSRLAAVWTGTREATAGVAGAMLTASVGRGIVRCILPADARDAARRVARIEASVIFERLPPDLWNELAPSPVSDRLSRALKQRFDPSNLMNPGVLGEPAS